MASTEHEDQRIREIARELEELRQRGHQDERTQIQVGIAEVRLELCHQNKTLARIDSTVHGNGNPGLTMRVDRLEQSHRRQSRIVKWAGGLVGTALAFVLERVWHKS
jgi:hypothetical protein